MRVATALALALHALIMMAVPAAAQKTPPPVIAILDVQRIIRDSTAATGIRSELEKHRSTYQTEITKQENDLRTADQELAQQRNVLSSEAFAERQREFQKRVASLGELVQKRKRQLDDAHAVAMKKVEDTLMTIVDELMKESSFNVVLPKSTVVRSAGNLEVTDEALKRLNKRLSAVQVVLPKE